MSGANGAWAPLAGVRVLDFTWMIAGPLGTRLLSNFGAEVLKVESYNRVDRIRETGPHPDAPWSFNEDGVFNDCNTGKRSILLNLNVPEGKDLARQLVAVCDVVAANFTGNRMDRWGLGYDDLVKVRPDLIFLNMPVFESAGPRQRWTGIGTHVNALSGINALSGFPDQPPYGLGVIYPDFAGNPYHAMAAVLAALLNRDRGGGGQFIELSQYESTASILGPALLGYQVTGENPERIGNHSPRACPHNVYPCAGEDRWLALEVTDDRTWQALCATLDRLDWAADERLASVAGRLAHQEELDLAIAAYTRLADRDELAQRLQSHGVAAAPVNNLAETLASPWFADEYFTKMLGPEGCVFTTAGEPIRPHLQPHPLVRAPLMGEHTDAVLHSLLGLERAHIDDLYARGALS